jgi:hypothetical protein
LRRAHRGIGHPSCLAELGEDLFDRVRFERVSVAEVEAAGEGLDRGGL